MIPYIILLLPNLLLYPAAHAATLYKCYDVMMTEYEPFERRCYKLGLVYYKTFDELNDCLPNVTNTGLLKYLRSHYSITGETYRLPLVGNVMEGTEVVPPFPPGVQDSRCEKLPDQVSQRTCFVIDGNNADYTCLVPVNCDGIDETGNQAGFHQTICETDALEITVEDMTEKPPPQTIAEPKKWIISRGRRIYRSYHSGRIAHHYSLTQSLPAGFTAEASPGLVVSLDHYPKLNASCPKLLKVGIWKSGTVSYIGNNPPASYVLKESFYCAPKQFYCGANHLLRRLDKQGGGDIFYASNENEANKQLLGNPKKEYSANWFKETPCWIWKNYQDTWHSIVRGAGGMIWGGYQKSGVVHFYTLQRHLVPSGFVQTAGPGYVVLQGLYDSYFKERCPELVAMKIWHGKNGKGQTVTWIGKEGKKPPAVLKTNVQEEPLRFYCAPRQNYCNANVLLRRMDKTDGSTFFYPHNEKEAQTQLKGAAPGVFKNTKWSEEVCFIWARW